MLDELGHHIGRVFRGETLTGQTVWFLEPLGRAGHAEHWDLPASDSREAAVRRLFCGDFVL